VAARRAAAARIIRNLLTLTDLLKFMARKEASDLHLKPMRPPLLRIKGRLVSVNTDILQPADIERMLLEILTPAQKLRLEQNQSVDIGYGLAGVARFRANSSTSSEARWPPHFAGSPTRSRRSGELGLPEILETFARFPSGLVLMTGPRDREVHDARRHPSDVIDDPAIFVVTIEGPDRVPLPGQLASVSQREVGTDTPSFHEALKNAMRQDPDVIMVGEMRDWRRCRPPSPPPRPGTSSSRRSTPTAPARRSTGSSTRARRASRTRCGRSSRSSCAIVSMRLIDKSDGQGAHPGLRDHRSTLPKIAKHIESGETKEILRGDGASVRTTNAVDEPVAHRACSSTGRSRSGARWRSRRTPRTCR
jgi:twitching motility protein PilT